MLPVLWHIFSFYWNFNKDPCPSLPVSFRVRIQLFAEPSSCILIAWLNCIAAANWARFGFGFVWKVKAKAECASMEPQPGRNEITARPQGKQSRTACGFLFILPKQSSAAKLEKKYIYRTEEHSTGLTEKDSEQSWENNFQTKKTHTWDLGARKCSGHLVGSHSGCPWRKWIVVNQFVPHQQGNNIAQLRGHFSIGVGGKVGALLPICSHGLRFVFKYCR